MKNLFLLTTTLAALLPTALANEQSDDPLLQGASQICPTYSCPQNYVPTPKWPLGIESTGCTSQTISGMDDSEHHYYRHCCHIKAACYQICGSNKQVCDKEMEKCMADVCEAVGDFGTKTEARELLNNVYKNMKGIGSITLEELEDFADMSEEELQKAKDGCTRSMGIVKLLGGFGGCGQFDAMQRRSCECVEKGKEKDKRERVLRAFYKKFSPDGVSKIPALLEKAGGKVSTFAVLLKNMVTKYPASIKKKAPEDPNARRPPKRKNKFEETQDALNNAGKRLDDLIDEVDAGMHDIKMEF